MLVLLGFVVCLYTHCGGQKINPYIMAYISFLLALKRCSIVLLYFSLFFLRFEESLWRSVNEILYCEGFSWNFKQVLNIIEL